MDQSNDSLKGRITSLQHTVTDQYQAKNPLSVLLKELSGSKSEGEIIEQCAALIPAYKSWSQRRYDLPKGFDQAFVQLRRAGANSCLIEDLVITSFKTNDRKMLPPSVMARAALPFIAARKFDVPFWCVEKNLFDALNMTTPPDKWECRVPFPSGYFLLPEALQGGVRALAWTRVNKDTDFGGFQLLFGDRDIADDIDMFVFTAVLPDGSSVFSHTGVLEGDIVDFSTLDNAPFAVADDSTDFMSDDQKPNETDYWLTTKTPRLLANLLAALTLPGFSDESNHRITGRVKASSGKGKKIKVDKWGVRILRDPAPPANGGHSTGSGEGGHASPKVHWRRGHWHTVLHGKGRLQRTLKWFRPVLVGIRENDDTEQNNANATTHS